jgi:TRAP-type mannitol/chloroaromatic compound transport system permease small subunit
MNGLLNLSRRIDALNRAVGALCRWIVLVMLGLGVWNVIGRYLGALVGRNLSSNSLIEAQWYAFAMVFLLAAAWTLEAGGHVRVDVLQGRWSPRRRARAELIGTLLLLIPFCLMMLVVSWGSVASSWSIFEASPDPGGLPRYPIKTVVPVGFTLLLLQGVSEAIKAWSRCRDGGAGDTHPRGGEG